MADKFGALEFPVVPTSTDIAAFDPGLQKIADYLAAVLNFDLSSEWQTVSPGKPFVQAAFGNNPKDSTFNERDLPALFVFRDHGSDEWLADDILASHTTIKILWVPATAEQAKRSLRSPSLNGYQKSISHALALGRHPAWSDSGDTDLEASDRGSQLLLRAGLARAPVVTTYRPEPLVIETDQDKRTYPGFVVYALIEETTNWDPSVGGAEAELDLAVTTPDGMAVFQISARGGFDAGFDAGFDGGGVGAAFNSGFDTGFS